MRSGFASHWPPVVCLYALPIACLYALIVISVAPGCSNRTTPQEWLERTTEIGRIAEQAASSGDIDAAREALQSILLAPPPPEMVPEDARIVMQDVYFRLAELELGVEGHREALQWANEGLALGNGEDVFTANLLVVRGLAREALGELGEAGSDYYDALRITDELLRLRLGQEEEQ